MDTDSRHLSAHIDRPVKEVYEYASNPANMTEWAPGLGTSIESADGQWLMDTPEGRIVVAFTPANEFGVLDHWVTLPTGETIYNPMRVTADGTGCEIVFSLRRAPGVSDDDFNRDAGAVLADLIRLKQIAERVAAVRSPGYGVME